MQSSDSCTGLDILYGLFGLISSSTFVLNLGYTNILALILTEATLIVEMRIWCIKTGTVYVLKMSLLLFHIFDDLMYL